MRVVGVGVVAVLSAFAMALTFSAPAAAKPSKSDLIKKIDKLGKKLDKASEEYNDAREKLKKTKKKAKKLNKELKPLQDKVDKLYGETGKIAEAAYKGGQATAVDAMISSGSPKTLIDQMATLDSLAIKHNKQIKKLNAAKADLDAKKKRIDSLLSDQRKLEKDLADKKKKIEKDLGRLEKMYEDNYGPLYPPEQDYGPPPYVGGKAQKIVDFAYAQLGEPYKYGAAGPNSWDCSGLTMGAYQQVGVSLPHSARQQYNSTGRVNRGDLKPGDLVFFYSDLHHVGIYIGSNTVIHAPQPGEYVKKSSIDAMPYAGGGRPNY